MAPASNSFFSVTHANDGESARVGCIRTAHGTTETPCFMPIASFGTLRAISFADAMELGTRVVMANAWHIHRDVGEATLVAAGGVHRVMGWPGILFTDSGGYQVFSLRDTSEIKDEGVILGNGTEMLTAVKVIEMQKCLGSDVMMVLDDCASHPCGKRRAREAVRRTTVWARESVTAHEFIAQRYEHSQALYGIVQGGVHEDLRLESIEGVAALGFAGYGIGGLSIGMPRSAIREMTVLSCEHLPADKPRHLLGVGLPWQILEGIEDGVDTFDCVLPIRKGQRGTAYVRTGEVHYKHVQPAEFGDRPLDPDCRCPVCQQYTREQLRRLYHADKPAAGRLACVHNLFFYHSVMQEARVAIRQGRFSEFKKAFMSDFGAEQKVGGFFDS